MLNPPIKKIAILLPSANVGGAERLILEELSFLINDHRFHFELHLVFEAGTLRDIFKKLGVSVHVWDAPHKSLRVILYYLKIVRYLRKEKFDILHVHLLYSIGPLVGLLAGLRVLTTIHSDVHYGPLERFCMRRSDLVLGCGSQVIRNLGNFIPGRKLKLLNNAIRPIALNTSQPKDTLSSMGLNGSNKIVLSIGRLMKVKGYDLLIEAFRRVLDKEPDAVLLIAGEGPDREKLEQQIKAAVLYKHVRLLGLVDNVNELLDLCDVYVNSSRWEGLPMTLLEAVAHKTPVVATDVGGNYEIVKNEETGLLVPPERADLLAEGILKILGDKIFADHLAEKAFELFEKNYSIEKHCSILASEYLS